MNPSPLPYRAIEWRGHYLRLLDQRLLPDQVTYVDYVSAAEVAGAIREMVVRGAPAIGLTAAYALALAAHHAPNALSELQTAVKAAAECLKASRPTAVNLFWAVQRMLACAYDPRQANAPEARAALLAEAQAIDAENLQMDLSIARHAYPLIPDGARIVHHCNTGPLATGGYGTALGAIRYAHERGVQVHVFVDETRPRLQGARLTAWELQQMGVPFTVIPDGASGHLMRTQKVDLCIVGCDRVAANGDTANKIGTYHLALAARAHGVPFYVAGPSSTIDPATPHGDAIPIEERPPDEVTHLAGRRITPEGAGVANPSFDVTPAAWISGIITEKGVSRPPYHFSEKSQE
jgi:methylthioribose-1-phosphate isomerase